MPYTRTDIDLLKRAIGTGATKVRFADNREVTYRSLADMRSTLAEMEREVFGPTAGRPVRFVAGYRSGLC